MNEIAFLIYLAIGIIIFIAYIIYQINLENTTLDQKFKKFYRKNKNKNGFLLCDYCINCKNKYTYERKIINYPYVQQVTRRVISSDCPINDDKECRNISICSKFELDKKKFDGD